MRIDPSSLTNRKRRVWWRTVLFSERYEYRPSPMARGLHPERRTVHRGHTTFQQTYWVRGETPELLEARTASPKSKPSSASSPAPSPSSSPPSTPAEAPALPDAGASAAPRLDAYTLNEAVRTVLRRSIDQLNPIERQMILAHFAVRIHENGDAVGHPVMMLSAPGVGKSTLWDALRKLTDSLAEQESAPMRVHIVDMQSIVLHIGEALGAQAIDEGIVRFMFTRDLEDKIRYCQAHDVPLVLVFDEATKAPSILRTMLTLVTNGIVADRRLGVPFRVVMLGNRADWAGEMEQLGTALMPFSDRFLYYVTTPNEEQAYIRALQQFVSTEAEVSPEEQEQASRRLERFLLESDAEAKQEAREARLQRQMSRAELAGAAGIVEQMRAKIRAGQPAESVLHEHRDLVNLLRLMTDMDIRSDLRTVTAPTNYRIFSALVDSMLDGELKPMFDSFLYDPEFMPDFGSLDSDMKHMSIRRAMIIADQLSILFALGYDLESPEVDRFLASNVGRPHIAKFHTIIQDALKPLDAESFASVITDAALNESYHARKVNTATRVHDTAEHEKMFITHSDRAKEAGSPHTQAVFDGRPISTIADLIDALAQQDDDMPPSEHEPFSGIPDALPLRYLDTDSGRVHIGTSPEGYVELHMPGFDSHASATLTRAKHLLHLAGQPNEPAGHALHLSDIAPNSPLGRGVRSILGSGDPETVAQRLQEAHADTKRSLDRLTAMLEPLQQEPLPMSNEELASHVEAISREAHRAAAGMGILSMFHTPVIDSQTMQEVLPDEIEDEYRAYHEDAKRAQRKELARLTGHSPESVDRILSHPAVNAAPLHASLRGAAREVSDGYWKTLNQHTLWRALTPHARAELLHAMHLLASHAQMVDVPYGTIAERKE
jgi:MoxR-like ATPase